MLDMCSFENILYWGVVNRIVANFMEFVACAFLLQILVKLLDYCEKMSGIVFL